MVLIFILLGMDLFGGFYPRPEFNYTSGTYPQLFADEWLTWDEDQPSRYHFDDIGNAFLAIFVVLSGENWNEIMFNNHRATWDNNIKQPLPIPFAIIYFLALFVIGNLLLFNLFIAILLSNFDDDEEEEEEAEDAESKGADAPEQTMTWTFGQYRNSNNPRGSSMTSKGLGGDETGSSLAGEDSKHHSTEELTAEEMEDLIGFPANAAEGNYDMSCKVLSWDNKVRRGCATIIRHKYFEGFVLILILMSTLTLIIDLPHMSERTPLRTTLGWINVVFTVLFTLEMLIKMCSLGFFGTREAYFKSEIGRAHV